MVRTDVFSYNTHYSGNTSDTANLPGQCPGYFKLCIFILRESGREDPLYTCSICVIMHAQTCDMQQRLMPAQELLSRIAKNFRERKLT